MSHVIDLFRRRGVAIKRDTEGGFILSPKSAITAEVRDLVKLHRAELYDALPGPDLGYTLADLSEMGKLLREIAGLEGWSEDGLADVLDQLQRMAPINVSAALKAIRAHHDRWRRTWPDAPAERPKFRLCVLTVIDGGKRDSKPARPAKSLDPEPEAA